MKITINVTVGLGGGWDQDRVYKEIAIETERRDDSDLPWAQICAGLVEATIQERLHPTEDQEEDEGA